MISSRNWRIRPRKEENSRETCYEKFVLSFSSRPSINLCTTSKLRLMSYHMEDDVSRWRIGVASPDKRCNWGLRVGEQQCSNNKRWSIILSTLFFLQLYIRVLFSCTTQTRVFRNWKTCTGTRFLSRNVLRPTRRYVE